MPRLIGWVVQAIRGVVAATLGGATGARYGPRLGFYIGAPILWSSLYWGGYPYYDYYGPRTVIYRDVERYPASYPQGYMEPAPTTEIDPSPGRPGAGPGVPELLRFGQGVFPEGHELPRGLALRPTRGNGRLLYRVLRFVRSRRAEERLDVRERASAAKRRQRAPDSLAVVFLDETRVADRAPRRSVSSRIKRPAPCFKAITARGSW